MKDLIVKVPKHHRLRAGIPDKPVKVISSWSMGGSKIGVWVNSPEGGTRVWPIMSVTADEVKGWAVD